MLEHLQAAHLLLLEEHTNHLALYFFGGLMNPTVSAKLTNRAFPVAFLRLGSTSCRGFLCTTTTVINPEADGRALYKLLSIYIVINCNSCGCTAHVELHRKFPRL